MGILYIITALGQFQKVVCIFRSGLKNFLVLTEKVKEKSFMVELSLQKFSRKEILPSFSASKTSLPLH